MRMDGTSGLRAAALVTAIACFATPATAEGQVSSYLDYDDFSDELERVVDGSPLASMRTIGTSLQGRDIVLVEIADDDGPPTGLRPAVLVVGNLSGDHVVGSHLALEVIRYLAGPGAEEADLTNHVVYVVPRLNPDGAEAMFSGLAWGRRGNMRPHDDDNDGRTDEDGPNDLNGDGVVTVMRVADPAGEYMVDPDDPRFMRRVDRAAGERGTHTLYLEGRDDDGDGWINEDGPGGVDLDRNFQHAYPYWEADAGVHMVSEPESRALMEFVIAHTNISAVVTFGHSDNLVTPPNGQGRLADAVGIDLRDFAEASLDGIFDEGVWGVPFQPGGLRLRGAQPGADNDPNSGRRPQTTVHGDDLDYFEAVSDAYTEVTGIEEVALNREAEGAFFQYGYYQFGIPSFSTPGWAPPDVEDAPGEGDARLAARLEAAGVDAFVPWASYDHPELGAVEIGGFHPYTTVNPPASEIAAAGEANGRFVARLSSMHARVRLADVTAEAHGGGLFTVSATVVNDGYFPSSLRQGVISRTVDPVLVQIQVDPDQVVTGAAKSHRIQTLAGSGTRETVSWVVRADSGQQIEVTVRSEKGGSDSSTVRLGGVR